MTRHTVRERLRDESGAVVVIVAVSLVILLLSGAFVVDLGQARQRARSNQNAADSGATAGAVGLPGSASGNPSAQEFAADYAFQTMLERSAPPAVACPVSSEVPSGPTQCFQDAGGGPIVYVTTPWGPDTVADPGVAAPSGNQIHVKVCTDVPTELARIIDITNIRTCRQATAINTLPLSPLLCAICVMRPSDSNTLLVSGSGNVRVNGGDVVVNSDANCAARLTASGSVIASPGAITIRQPGTDCEPGSGSFSPEPTNVPALMPDPLPDLTLPSHPGCPPNPPPASCNNITLSGSQSAVINPGHWRRITVSDSATLRMNPGVYVIRGTPPPNVVGLEITGSGSVIANGVTLIFTCESYDGPSPSSCPSPQRGARLVMSGSGNLTITAPTTLTGDLAKYNGLAIFFDRNNEWGRAQMPGIMLSGSGNLNVTGTIYALRSWLSLTASGSTKVLNSSVVVDQFEASGSGSLTVNFDPDQNVRTVGGIALIS